METEGRSGGGKKQGGEGGVGRGVTANRAASGLTSAKIGAPGQRSRSCVHHILKVEYIGRMDNTVAAAVQTGIHPPQEAVGAIDEINNVIEDRIV